MRRDQIAFLVGGFAFGVLFGFGVFHHFFDPPVSPSARAATVPAEIPSPAGPMAPTQTGQAVPGAQSTAPMMQQIGNLKRVLEQDENNVAALVQLGNIYYDVSMWNEAITYYERALQVAPNDPDVLTDLGIAYKNVNRFEEALEKFNEAYRVDSNHWQSLYNTVVVAALHLGRFDVADDALAKLETIEAAGRRVAPLRDAVERARATGARPENPS